MALVTYKKLVLRWQPSPRKDRAFLLILTVTVVVALLAGIYLSSIDVPEKPRVARPNVPERVARFITQKPELKPKRQEVKPVQPPPSPKVTPRVEPPSVVRQRPTRAPEPVTEAQKAAREKASQSGLMAHMNEINQLRDSQEVRAQVRGTIRSSDEGRVARGHSADILTSGTNEGSGGIDGARYSTTAGNSQLSVAELSATQEALDASEAAFARSSRESSDTRSRSQEEITLVIDRHKSQLQGLYNRARRSNPGLRGSLLLAITIQPDGSVSAVKVVSSELNDRALEQRLVARIQAMQFEEKDVESVTVNYPIEFLPS